MTGCGFLGNSPLTRFRFAAFAVADAGKNDSNNKNNSENNTKNKPKWADDDILLGSRDSIIKINCLGDFKNAKRWEVVDAVADIAYGLGEDDFFKFI